MTALEPRSSCAGEIVKDGNHRQRLVGRVHTGGGVDADGHLLLRIGKEHNRAVGHRLAGGQRFFDDLLQGRGKDRQRLADDLVGFQVGKARGRLAESGDLELRVHDKNSGFDGTQEDPREVQPLRSV